MLNGEGYNDPTPTKALKRCGVMREAEIERMDELRYKPPRFSDLSEAEEQESLMKWAAILSKKYPALFRMLHIPNGGSRHPAEALHLKRMGVKPGVPDLLLPFPVEPYHGLWIEMKSLTGKPTALQKDWVEWLRSVGYAAYICNGAEQAIERIEEYLGINTRQEEKNGRKGENS